jgi:hypothetical protein
MMPRITDSTEFLARQCAHAALPKKKSMLSTVNALAGTIVNIIRFSVYGGPERLRKSGF